MFYLLASYDIETVAHIINRLSYQCLPFFHALSRLLKEMNAFFPRSKTEKFQFNASGEMSQSHDMLLNSYDSQF